jgi:hypothetical protein
MCPLLIESQSHAKAFRTKAALQEGCVLRPCGPALPGEFLLTRVPAGRGQAAGTPCWRGSMAFLFPSGFHILFH